MRKELVFPCDNIVNFINIRSCLHGKALRSLGSKGKPGFGDHSDSPEEACYHIVAEQPGKSPASGSGQTVRERPGIR